MLISKRRCSPATAAALILGLAACAGGDERTEQVLPGMSRDSAMAALNAPVAPGAADSAAPGDSLRNVWRRTQYLVNGVNIEVIWYSPSGEKWKATDTIPQERVIPVVLLDGKVAGVGRSAYDRVAEAYRLPANKY